MSFLAAMLAASAAPTLAADFPQQPKISMIDPTPVAEQAVAVDGINFKFGAVTGVLGGYSNHMFLASVAMPMPWASSFGAQLDLGIGNYRHDYVSAAVGLHLFWRDPSTGLIGIYGDWGYVNPEHAGRIGVEGSLYLDRVTLDGFVGVQFGQHVLTRFVDELDLSYYFTDNFKGSIGHRLISRGHVGNVAFEYMPENMGGWSVYGEAEIGEDDYNGAWLGLRYSFGQSGAKTLIDRDRRADPMVRIPRNLASVTRCGNGDPHPSWNGFEFHDTINLCGSAADLRDYNGKEGKL